MVQIVVLIVGVLGRLFGGLFIVSKTAPTEPIFRGVLWFFVADMLPVALVIAVSDVVMWQPKRVG